MTVLHFVSNRILPYPGGLQESLMRIGGSLARAGFEVIVYTLHQPPDFRFADPSHEGLTIVHVDDRESLLEPFRGEGQSALLAAESNRVTALLLGNAIDRQVAKHSDARHVIISFYASGTGFLAQMAAASLRLPHVVSVRGTDFELDAFGPKHPLLRVALEGATQVVTTNQEQADSIAAIFRPRQPVRTIHNALPASGPRLLWELPPSDGIIHLISDCGFSGRKATQLLLRAAAQLMDRGLPISLTVLGGIFWLESLAYWEQCQRSYQSRYPGRFSFPGHVAHDELDRHLRAAHIYCSASLAEGSSMSRIRALTIGIPIVTTANGGLPDVAAGCRHVRLCPAGDWEALAAELETAIAEIRAGTLHPDPEYIERWRQHFSVERELEEWTSAIRATLAASGAHA